ncbi:hypothetical protein Celaphus_00012970 [Cervus elaphus hippelaphus]|uniref:Uncharacterized protein n=1 Tax=Cervus elaphus hippelaphus TaxID=46360 RepID=A0A212CID4_CEREH|nr:hypothetical protein Celaphus_00012970 [Cervus elaphus hippelaphus]
MNPTEGFIQELLVKPRGLHKQPAFHQPSPFGGGNLTPSRIEPGRRRPDPLRPRRPPAASRLNKLNKKYIIDMIEDMNPTFEAALKPPTAESPGDLTKLPSACKQAATELYLGSWDVAQRSMAVGNGLVLPPCAHPAAEARLPGGEPHSPNDSNQVVEGFVDVERWVLGTGFYVRNLEGKAESLRYTKPLALKNAKFSESPRNPAEPPGTYNLKPWGWKRGLRAAGCLGLKPHTCCKAVTVTHAHAGHHAVAISNDS